MNYKQWFPSQTTKKKVHIMMFAIFHKFARLSIQFHKIIMHCPWIGKKKKRSKDDNLNN
jgi:hypothetical protein